MKCGLFIMQQMFTVNNKLLQKFQFWKLLERDKDILIMHRKDIWRLRESLFINST